METAIAAGLILVFVAGIAIYTDRNDKRKATSGTKQENGRADDQTFKIDP